MTKTDFALSLHDEKIHKFAITAIRRYGFYTIENRAVPDYRDGLKPVQRRAMWAMHELGLRSSGGTKKTARVVGDCFAAGTGISTPNGKIPIESLNVGDIVSTSRGPKPITHIIGNKNAKMFMLELQDGKSVVQSEKQKVKIKIGDEFFWKSASDLSPEDEIVVE